MSENAEDLDECERGHWARHYDTLLWSVTTIFAGAIGGLLVYVHSNFDIRLAVFGLIITPVPVYFGASFRELHSKSMSRNAKRVIQRDRTLYQWEVYVAVFVLLEILWGLLLVSKESFIASLAVVLEAVVVSATVWMERQGRRERRSNQSSTEEEKDA